MGKKYLMVRAVSAYDDRFEVFFDKSVAAIGWSEIRFADYPADKIEALIKTLEDCYYSLTEIPTPTMDKQLKEVRLFHSINAGDYIVVPFYDSIRLAMAEDSIIYSKDAYDTDLANQRRVRYQLTGPLLKTVPREALSKALQSSLSVPRLVVSDLYEFREEIENLFCKSDYSWKSYFEEKNIKIISELKAEYEQVKAMKNEAMKKQEFDKSALLCERLREISQLIAKARTGQ